MGLIRLLLAISVITTHSSLIFGCAFAGGQVAVQSFYIISGFYMALILNEKYVGKNSYTLFISNRFLRLYPIYWIILVLTVVVEFTFTDTKYQMISNYGEFLPEMSLTTILFLLFTNATMFFQDVVMFLGFDHTTGNLFLTSNFSKYSPSVHTFLFLPQAWTIGIELMFYLVAPLIVRRKLRIIVLIIVMSIIVRAVLMLNGLYRDPWTYRFFPTEITFFLLGSVSYWIYCKIKNKKISNYISFGVYSIVLLFTIGFFWFPGHFFVKAFLYYFIFFLSLPIIFKLSRNWKVDSYIGELSYPAYVCHILIITVVPLFVNVNNMYNGIYITVVTIAFSILLNELVSKRIEIIRQRRLKHAGN